MPLKMILLGLLVFCAALAFPFGAQHISDSIGHEKRVELWLAAIFIAVVRGKK